MLLVMGLIVALVRARELCHASAGFLFPHRLHCLSYRNLKHFNRIVPSYMQGQGTSTDSTSQARRSGGRAGDEAT
jgi:hypothetical protein